MSDLPVLKIDSEFESIIPPLDEEEFRQLTDNILRDGEIYHPIIIWNETIVDGHHRYKILKANPTLKYRIEEKVFSNRYDAISWICLNQLGRRNLSPIQKIALMGRRYNAEKESLEVGHRFLGNQYTSLLCPQNEGIADGHNKTAKRIAKEMGVSHATVQRAKEFVDGMEAAEEVLPGISREIISGKIKPTQKAVADIARAPSEERRELVERLRFKEQLSDEQREVRKQQRLLIQTISGADHRHNSVKRDRVSVDKMVESLAYTVDMMISTCDMYFRDYPEMISNPDYCKRVIGIFLEFKNYIEKIERNDYEQYKPQTQLRSEIHDEDTDE